MGWLIALEDQVCIDITVGNEWFEQPALDFWFVLGMGWGVEGVAWATFIAEWFAFLWAWEYVALSISKNRWSLIFSEQK